MTPDPAPTRRYYLGIDGQPQGPFSAAEVLGKWQAGQIPGTTLVCADGGAAWETVQELAGALRQEAGALPPPVMPVTPFPPVAPPPVASGYVTAAPPAPAPSGYQMAAPPVSPGYQTMAPPVPSGYAPAAPPPAPSGYSTAAPPMENAAPRRDDDEPESRPRYHTPRSQQREAEVKPAPPSDNTKGIRLVALLAALGCFFLPWLEFRCSKQPMVTQSGLQIVTKSASLDGEFLKKMQAMLAERGMPAEQLPPEDKLKENIEKSLDPSYLTGVAMLCAGLALFLGMGENGRTSSGMLAAAALACLLIVMWGGFPMEEASKKGMEHGMQQAQAADPGGSSPGYQMGMEMGKSLFKVEYTPWFYTVLGSLGVVALLGFTGGSSGGTGRKP